MPARTVLVSTPDGGTRRIRAAARSPRHAAQLDDFARELVRARCRLHSDLAICDQCVAPRSLDSTGFPNVTLANGRGRYKRCPDCGKLFAIADWHFGAVLRENGSTAFAGMCKSCAG